MQQATKARWLLILSMTIFGTLGLFVRNIPVSSGELALYRAVLAAILIGVFLLVMKQKIPFSSIRKDIPLLLVSGMAMGINWILLFEAYKYTTVSVATLSYYFAPVIVTAVCPILFREKLTGKQNAEAKADVEKGISELEQLRDMFEQGIAEAEKLYALNPECFIFDDRTNVRNGEKFADAELMGIPYRVVISDKTLAKKQIEILDRKNNETKLLTLSAFTRKLS